MDKDKALSELAETYKPRLILPLYSSLVCIAPLIILLVNIINENYEHLFLKTIFTMVAIAANTFVWSSYYYQYNNYKDEIADYIRDPESYEW